VGSSQVDLLADIVVATEAEKHAWRGQGAGLDSHHTAYTSVVYAQASDLF
jgi:hypothetical protein